MRIDKKNNAIYTKELDEMEKYFLNMFKRFIENDPGFLDKSVESIITEAVKRSKKEIIFETSAGVLSINHMSGVVKLTLDDLGGEPKIVAKYSAFNRHFGVKENTVCEGNDKRLSDARVPLEHNHNDLYYQKSETATHTQDGYMDRLDKIKLDKIDYNANNYIHPSGSGYNHVPSGGSGGQYLAWHNNGEAEWKDLTLNRVNATTDGIMSKEDKVKLDGIEANVKTYVHPISSGHKHIPTGGSTGQTLKWVNDGEAYWCDTVKYIHPDFHPATIIMSDATHRFVTDEQIKEWNEKGYIHPITPGNKHIPSGGGIGQVLEWKADGEAKWKDQRLDKTTFESLRIKKRGVCSISLDAGISESYTEVDLSKINFFNSPTYNAYYINNDSAKEQVPTILFNGLEVSDVIKAYIDSNKLKITVARKDTTASKSYNIYYEIFDIDNSLTVERAESIKVLNIYPGIPSNGESYTFTNWKGETVTLPKTAQCKMWMEKPNDESPKGYGQGFISVDVVNIDDFNVDPYSYLKDSHGNWKYQTAYLGAWDSNNGKSYSSAAVIALTEFINAGCGYISGHDTPWSPFATLMGIKSYNNTSSGIWVGNSKVKVFKAGFVSSFPWNLGDINTELIVPYSHVSSQYHTGDIWFKYEPPNGFVDVESVDGAHGTCNFYLGTYRNTAFIQTGHSNGAASSDEQKILANVFYYLADRGI